MALPAGRSPGVVGERERERNDGTDTKVEEGNVFSSAKGIKPWLHSQ